MARNDYRETEGFGSVIGSAIPAQHVVTGWKERHDSGPIAIAGLMPFVQLIGLYNEEEIDRLIGNKLSAAGRSAVYVDDSGAVVAPDDQEELFDEVPDNRAAQTITREQRNYFENQIRSKYIWLGIKDYDIPEDDLGTPARMVPGIMLATNYSQAGTNAYEYYTETGMPKDSGGVGITDLQIETGTKDFMNRRYKLRVTVTDPQILNDQAEYVKLSSLQSQFLIIHGWANPQEINNWSGDAPPQLIDVGSEEWPNGRMLVDLRQNNTGGMWGAAIVATTMFDFAFNEVGQLEASFTFMPREISFLATYRVSTFADNINAFLGSGEQNDPVSRDEPEQIPSLFAGFATGFGAVAGEFGKNLADVIYEEQSRYFGDNSAIADLFANADLDFSVSDTLRNLSERISEWGEMPESVGRLMDRQRYAESNYRFPFAGPGIRSYTQTSRRVADVTGQPANEDAEMATRAVIQHDSKIVYYYLGWVLEALRFSMWDMNRNKVRNGQKPFDVKFKYFNIPQDSHYNLSFQDSLKASLPSDINGQVAEAMKNLKINGFPKPRFWDPVYQELNPQNVKDRVNVNSVSKRGSDSQPGDEPRNVAPLPIVAKQVRQRLPMNKTTTEGHEVYQIMGDISEERFKRKNWEPLSDEEKFLRIPGGTETSADYRRSLVETDESDPAGPGYVRIMHPEFEGQLLYNITWEGDIRVDHSDDKHESNCGLYRQSHRGLYAHASFDDTGSESGGDKWKAGGFLFSKLKNFYVGEYNNVNLRDERRKMTIDNIAAGNPLSGIICPAISARYFTGNRYKREQQKWFNKHINFLSNYFEFMIRERMIAATESEGIVNSNASLLFEPIDLTWLTGRKYNNIFQRKVGSRARTGTGAVTPDYDMTDYALFNPEKVATPLAARRRLNREAALADITTTISSNSVARAADNRVSGQLAAAYVKGIWEVDEVNLSKIVVDETALNLSRLEDSLAVNYEQVDATTRQLNGTGLGENDLAYMGPGGASEILEQSNLETTSLEELEKKEDAVVVYEKRYNGLLGAIAFWNGRIDQVLKDLYNKDLITLSNAGTSDQLTLGGDSVAPLEIIDPDAAAPASDESAADDRSGPVGTPRAEFRPAGHGDLRGEGVNRYRYTQDDVAGREFGNLLRVINGYKLRFFNNGVEVVTPSKDVSYADMVKEGISRYLFLDFQSSERWELNSRTVKIIGISEITTGGPVQTYIYMNYIDPALRDSYTNADALYDAAAGDVDISIAISQAETRYLAYIEKMRSLLNNYLSKLEYLMGEANLPQATLQRTLIKIDEAENTQSAILTMNRALAGQGKKLSPFDKGSLLDVETKLPRGGGRVLRLKGTVAQQWAMMLEKRMVYGAGKIKNYGPYIGGTSVLSPDKQFYGWGEIRQTLHPAGSFGGFPGYARLNNWLEPKSIVNRHMIATAETYKWIDEDGESHEDRMTMEAAYWSGRHSTPGLQKPFRDMSSTIGRTVDGNGRTRPADWNRQPNFLFQEGYAWEQQISMTNQPPSADGPYAIRTGNPLRGSFETRGSRGAGDPFRWFYADSTSNINRHLKVKWVVRAGVIDCDLIRSIAINNFGEEWEGLRLAGEEGYEAAPKKIAGLWPYMMTHQSTRHFGVPEGPYEIGDHDYYSGLLYMVDEDLDFVIQAKDALRVLTGPLNYATGYWFGARGVQIFDPLTDFVSGEYMATRGARSSSTYDGRPGTSLADAEMRAAIDYSGWSGVSAYDWIKMPHGRTKPFASTGSISGPIFCPVPEGPTLAYPGAALSWQSTAEDHDPVWRVDETVTLSNRKVGVPLGNHLPDLPVSVVRQLVQNNEAGPSGVPMFSFNKDFPYGISLANVARIRKDSEGYHQGGTNYEFMYEFEGEDSSANVHIWNEDGTRNQNEGDEKKNVDGGQCVNDLLNSLPADFERGFFSSVKWADRNFEGGAPLNEGLVEFLYTEFFNLFSDGRRIGIGQKGTYLNNLERDFTYFNALFPEDEEREAADISHTMMADFSNQNIQNVAEIPIKRDVLTNLLNRKNENMSLLQFLRQLLSPSSIGLAGNIQLGVRNTGRNIEIIPASISYKQIETDILAEEVVKQLEVDIKEGDPPKYLLFDYKTKNSLIESVDMSSKMDPAAFLTYQNSSDILRGRDYNVLKILSYEGVAEDFKEFLDNTPKTDDSGAFYNGIITMDSTNQVRVNKDKFKDVPSSIIDSFIGQQPERWAKITSMMQGNNNFTTELLAFYMRGVTLIIHGTTNLQPFNIISVKGVLPDLEGLYIITNLTEKVTPSSFQTIIEGKLLKRRRVSEQIFI